MGVLEVQETIDRVIHVMDQMMPTNLSMERSHDKNNNNYNNDASLAASSSSPPSSKSTTINDVNLEPLKSLDSASETKINLSFSVDRLLNRNNNEQNSLTDENSEKFVQKCCENQCSYCSYSNCHLLQTTALATATTTDASVNPLEHSINLKSYANSGLHNNSSNTRYHHDVTISAVSSSSSSSASSYVDFKTILRPTPIRAIGENVQSGQSSYPTSSALLRFHHSPLKQHQQQTLLSQHQQQHQPQQHHHQQPQQQQHYRAIPNIQMHQSNILQQSTAPAAAAAAHRNFAFSTLMAPLNHLKTLQINQHVMVAQQQHQQQQQQQHQHYRHSSINNRCFHQATTKAVHGSGTSIVDMPALAFSHTTTNTAANHHHRHHHPQLNSLGISSLNMLSPIATNSSNSNNSNSSGTTTISTTNTHSANSHSNATNATTHNNTTNKRKRSWSRAVFSNLQRKGLEIQFQQQKYITKPDRRKLAARLNLTDAQVKVWFQNRRMKWRHTRENLKSGQEKQVTTSNSSNAEAKSQQREQKMPPPPSEMGFAISTLQPSGYSSECDGTSSIDMSCDENESNIDHDDNDDDDDKDDGDGDGDYNDNDDDSDDEIDVVE